MKKMKTRWRVERGRRGFELEGVPKLPKARVEAGAGWPPNNEDLQQTTASGAEGTYANSQTTKGTRAVTVKDRLNFEKLWNFEITKSKKVKD